MFFDHGDIWQRQKAEQAEWRNKTEQAEWQNKTEQAERGEEHMFPYLLSRYTQLNLIILKWDRDLNLLIYSMAILFWLRRVS